jgi:hypothetical protein
MFDLRSLILATRGSGAVCDNYGPYGFPALLDGSASWLVKGIDIPASQSRLIMPWDTSLSPDSGSISFFVQPFWEYNDNLYHYLFFNYDPVNPRFYLLKNSSNLFSLVTNTTSRGSFSFQFVSGSLYFICLNWGANELFINGSLVYTFSPGGLVSPASTLYLCDHYATAFRTFLCHFFLCTLHKYPLSLSQVNILYDLYRPFFEV